jgi:hypothetical protein
MPARHRIAALTAALALAAPSAALAQAGAGDSEYQDPFGAPASTSTGSGATPAPAPGATASTGTDSALGTATPEVVRDAPATKTAGGSGGLDVLPVAAAGLVLLLGGVALWRRPHAPK